MARLKDKFSTEVAPAMMEKFGYKNVMQIPKIEKVVINMGVSDLTMIAGQRPVVTKAKKSIAAFKIREGMAIGTKVTLRGERMYQFLDKLLNVSLPRVRDFRGVSPRAFDGRGNYTLGIKEQLIFPEIEYDKVDKIRGMDIVIVTTAKSDEEAREMLKLMGMPFSA
ncbi:MAG: Ribosomal protein [Firmicutes bacterium]|nr:Ribosomal protein [Bacillota bacterium]